MVRVRVRVRVGVGARSRVTFVLPRGVSCLLVSCLVMASRSLLLSCFTASGNQLLPTPMLFYTSLGWIHIVRRVQDPAWSLPPSPNYK
jgi:hypothetical protein